MSGESGQPVYERETLDHLRRWLRDPASEADRTALALFFSRYLRSFLLATHARWSFGFRRPFSEVVDDVARWESAHLLGFGKHAGSPPEPRRLLRGLTGALGLPPVLGASAAADRLSEIGDERLGTGLRRLLQITAHQGAIREYDREHPEEALLRRCLKLWCRRRGTIRVVWDVRRHLLVVPGCDLTREPVSRAELRAALGHASSAVSFTALAEAVKSKLDEETAGYCYFHDAVRAVHDHLQAVLRGESVHTGALPASSGHHLSRDGRPAGGWELHAREVFLERAMELIRRDRRHWTGDARPLRPRRRFRPSPEEHQAWAVITVEKLLRPCGLGNPQWEGLDERGLIRLLIPSAGERIGLHREGIRYLLRRLRRWVRESPGAAARELWDPAVAGMQRETRGR